MERIGGRGGLMPTEGHDWIRCSLLTQLFSQRPEEALQDAVRRLRIIRCVSVEYCVTSIKYAISELPVNFFQANVTPAQGFLIPVKPV